MDDQLIAIYLNDHLAAATGGLGLVNRARDAQASTNRELHWFLDELSREIADDRQVVVRALQALGARQDPLKRAVGAVAERLGRLKLNGRFVSRSPLSDLIELEGLTIAVQGKRAGWIVLQELQHPKLAGIDFAHLIARAEDQSTRIEAHRRPLARRVLSGEGR